MSSFARFVRFYYNQKIVENIFARFYMGMFGVDSNTHACMHACIALTNIQAHCFIIRNFWCGLERGLSIQDFAFFLWLGMECFKGVRDVFICHLGNWIIIVCNSQVSINFLWLLFCGVCVDAVAVYRSVKVNEHTKGNFGINVTIIC